MTGEPEGRAPGAAPRVPAPRRDAERSRALTARAFAARSAAIGALDAHEVQMRSSRTLLEAARALCDRVEALQPRAPVAPAPRPARAQAGGPRCAVAACGRPAPFQPCFVVELGDCRVLVRDLPMRFCAEHRGDLGAVFQRAHVVQALRRKLRARGREAPESVRVVFEVAS